MPHLLVFFLQLVLVTFVSVQMDLAGQYRVQVVGNIPSGSVHGVSVSKSNDKVLSLTIFKM